MTRARTLAKNAAGHKRPKEATLPGSWWSVPGKKLNAFIFVLLAGATIALYRPVLGHSFIVFDDREYVTANPCVHDGLRWSTIKWAFRSTTAANWHPLTWLSHALDCQLFGLNPAGHHFDSVLLHSLNAGLLFLLLVWATKRVKPSLLVAALFAVHPINVESVAWVAERKNVLSTLFFFLTIAAYGRYVRKPDWQRYLPVAVLFAAGLMAKPMVITLPFVLLLLDYWPLDRALHGETSHGANLGGETKLTFSKLFLEKAPLLLLSAASAWITMKVQKGAEHSLEEFTLATRIENALVSYGLYLWKMLWPARLAFYPHPLAPLPAWQWILSALVLITVTSFVLAFHRKRYLPVGWFWFLGTLVPVLGLVQVGEASMADRYAYIPLIGIFVMIAWGLDDWATGKKVSMLWQVVPALCVLSALSFAAVRQMGYWDSDYHLWSHTLELGENPLTHNALGIALISPDSGMTSQDLENFGDGQERMDAARRHFERAFELRQAAAGKIPDAYLSDVARTLNNLQNVDRLQNRIDEARSHGEKALTIYRQLAAQNPEGYLHYLAGALDNVGTIDRMQNRMDEARQHYEEALKIQRALAEQNPTKYLPNLAMTLDEFGRLDASQNRTDEARQHYEEALKIHHQLAEQSPAVFLPDLAMTLNEIGILDATENRMDDARQHYGEAVHIQRQLAEQNPAVYLPSLALTLNNLGRVDQLQGRLEEARSQYGESLILFRRLFQGDNRYAGDVARVQAILQELNQSQAGSAK